MKPRPSDDPEVRKSEIRERWAARATNAAFAEVNRQPVGTLSPAQTVVRHIAWDRDVPCPCSCSATCGCAPEDVA